MNLKNLSLCMLAAIYAPSDKLTAVKSTLKTTKATNHSTIAARENRLQHLKNLVDIARTMPSMKNNPHIFAKSISGIDAYKIMSLSSQMILDCTIYNHDNILVFEDHISMHQITLNTFQVREYEHADFLDHLQKIGAEAVQRNTYANDTDKLMSAISLEAIFAANICFPDPSLRTEACISLRTVFPTLTCKYLYSSDGKTSDYIKTYPKEFRDQRDDLTTFDNLFFLFNGTLYYTSKRKAQSLYISQDQPIRHLQFSSTLSNNFLPLANRYHPSDLFNYISKANFSSSLIQHGNAPSMLLSKVIDSIDCLKQRKGYIKIKINGKILQLPIIRTGNHLAIQVEDYHNHHDTMEFITYLSSLTTFAILSCETIFQYDGFIEINKFNIFASGNTDTVGYYEYISDNTVWTYENNKIVWTQRLKNHIYYFLFLHKQDNYPGQKDLNISLERFYKKYDLYFYRHLYNHIAGMVKPTYAVMNNCTESPSYSDRSRYED